MDGGLARRRHEYQSDVPLGKLPVELEDGQPRVGLGGWVPSCAAVGSARQVPRVQESGPRAILDVGPIEQPSLTTDIAPFVAATEVNEELLSWRQRELREERLGVQVLLVLFDRLLKNVVATKHLGGPTAIFLGEGSHRPRQGSEDVAPLRPSGGALAWPRLPQLAVCLHRRNHEEREQPDQEERPFHTRADLGLADLDLGSVFAVLSCGGLGHGLRRPNGRQKMK